MKRRERRRREKRHGIRRITDQDRGQPVISVGAPKKELVGDLKDGGREWQSKERPADFRVYNFIDKDLGKAIPYGVCDLTKNQGWVSVGIDYDITRFATETIRRLWSIMDISRYRSARELLITADGGGSNGSRCRLWKVALQDLATDPGLQIRVSLFPPATSKWIKIGHRMFSLITQNWRGRPLISHEVIINPIANTATQQGLITQVGLATGIYPTGIKVNDAALALVNLYRENFHGDWNYANAPGRSKKLDTIF